MTRMSIQYSHSEKYVFRLTRLFKAYLPAERYNAIMETTKERNSKLRRQFRPFSKMINDLLTIDN